MILPFKDGHIMDFKAVGRKAVSWDIFFLVASAMYVCNALSDDMTGVKPFLVQTLQPLLGDKPDMLFVLILLAFALITTNFANNTGMAIVLMPVVAAFADQYPNVPATAVCMSIGMMVFVALLTPAASPYCAMLHAKKDAISFNQIMLLGLPMCLIALLAYTFIGYPIAKILF